MLRPVALVALLASLLGAPGCGVKYVVSSAYYQAELLASRRPIDKVLASGGLSVGEEQRLRLLPEIKAYGATLGLGATDNYDTLAVGWRRTIWNVSGCAELAFEPRTWWFPIVGRVPYLGFFTEEAADRTADALRAEGLDVHRRTAGAYSTLGWFRDPVLPGMLRWSHSELAETVFHELAHATLWVPGSVAFNESFANFVGIEANHRYLAHLEGPDGPLLATTLRNERDGRRFEALLHGLYRDLDVVFRDPALSEADKRARKAELYASLPDRVRASEIENKERYLAAIARYPWNNARLMQFRTYNTDEERFATLLERSNGDLRAFIEEIRRITRRADDPFAALRAATEPPAASTSETSVQNP